MKTTKKQKPAVKTTVRPPVKTTSTKKAKTPKTFPPIVLRILKAVETIVDKSTTTAAAAVVAKIPPPLAPTPAPQPGPSLGAIQGVVRNELATDRASNPPTNNRQPPSWVNYLMLIICFILVFVALLALRENSTIKAAKAAQVAAESSEAVAKTVIEKMSTLATRENIKEEVKGDGDLTRKDIATATGTLIDKATLSVGEINKHSSGEARFTQEKVATINSSLEQIKKTLDDQKPAPTTDEMRKTIGETLLAFKRLDQPATSAEPVIVMPPTPTKAVEQERIDRETLTPGATSRRYRQSDVVARRVIVTKRYGVVTVNNHIPGTWHRSEQVIPVQIGLNQGITTYSDADWVTFISNSPMEIELQK